MANEEQVNVVVNQLSSNKLVRVEIWGKISFVFDQISSNFIDLGLQLTKQYCVLEETILWVETGTGEVEF